MANYGGDQVSLSFGGTNMTAYITEIGTVETMIALEKSTAFGVSWETFLSARLKSMKEVSIGGFYDDTAVTGPDVVFGTAALGTSATLLITYGSTKSTSVSAFVHDYQRVLKVGSLHKYKVSLQPSGPVTEA